MRNSKLVWLVVLVLFLAPLAHAASVSVSLTVTPTTSSGPVAPTVSWTSTGAARCVASDGWSGDKAAQGSETLAAVSKATKFSLTCTSPTGPATLSWIAPTANSDGSAASITGYQVMIGPSAATLSRGPLLPGTPTQGVVIQAPPGLQYFTVRAVGKIGGVDAESVDSAPTSKTVVPDQAVGTVTLAIDVKPNPPTNVVVK